MGITDTVDIHKTIITTTATKTGIITGITTTTTTVVVVAAPAADLDLVEGDH